MLMLRCFRQYPRHHTFGQLPRPLILLLDNFYHLPRFYIRSSRSLHTHSPLVSVFESFLNTFIITSGRPPVSSVSVSAVPYHSSVVVRIRIAFCTDRQHLCICTQPELFFQTPVFFIRHHFVQEAERDCTGFA